MKKWLRLLTLFVLVLALALTGCTAQSDRGSSRDDDDDDDRQEDIRTEVNYDPPEEVCEAFFAAYITLDGETAGALLSGMGEPYSFGTLTGLLAQNTKVTLGDAETEEETCRIPATVETIDLQAVLENIPEDTASTGEAGAWLAEALSDADAPRKTFETEVWLVLEEDEGWRVELTPSLSDALMGGYLTMLSAGAGEVQE